MRRTTCFWLSALAITALSAPGRAQDKSPAAALPAGNAALVNGRPITEVAVQRALKRVPPARQSEARPEIVNFLIDNALIEQYLVAQRVPVDDKDVDAKVKQVADEVKKEGSTFEKLLQDLMLTEPELRAQIAAQLRWDKFAADQSTDQALHDLFDNNHDMFDGTTVHARHVLLTPAEGNPKASEETRIRLADFKKQMEDEIAQGLAKLPASTDNLEREKMRAKLTEQAFITLATKVSDCPSKAQGGDLGWFPRAGSMVEPFAKVSFSLKPGQISDVVTTQFGHHLILILERRPGKEIKFDDMKDDVREVYGDRLREALLARLRPAATITITPPATKP